MKNIGLLSILIMFVCSSYAAKNGIQKEKTDSVKRYNEIGLVVTD